MADLAKQIGPVALTTVAATMYTVPGATTTVVQMIHVANETATPVALTISIGADGAGKRFERNLVVLGAGSYNWSGFMPLATGTVVQAYASVAAALTFIAGGVEIS